MIKDLFINMTILISFISIVSQLLKNYEIGPSSSLKIKIAIGIITGILGITLMVFGLKVDTKTILDFRNVVLTLAAVHGGPVSALICGMLVALYRIIYYGVSLSSIMGVILVAVVVIGNSAISKLKVKTSQKWSFSTFYNLILSSIALVVLLKGIVNLPYFLSVYWTTTLIVSVIVGYYSDYCITANALFKKLTVESSKDFLTGLNNVRNFDTLFNLAKNNALEKGEKLSLIMIDIDFFKKVNDTYGHAEGDAVLQQLGGILKESCRNFDIVSRNGGEEFTVLLLDCPLDYSVQIAERIRKGVEAHPFKLTNGIELYITVSLGVASYPEITQDAEKLLELSDTALYNAKRSGRNKVCYSELCSGDEPFCSTEAVKING